MNKPSKAALMILLIFALRVYATENMETYEVLGHVESMTFTDEQKIDNRDHSVDNVVSSMYGVLGMLISDVLSDITATRVKAYYTYKINTEDNRVFEVSNYKKYSVSECVKVIYPQLPGGYPESRVDSDTKLEPSNACSEISQ
jgi:hypothetical protein